MSRGFFRDVRTVMWRELKFLAPQGKRRLQVALSMLVPFGLSIWLPWEAGPDFLAGYIPSMLVSFVLPTLIVGTSIPDSFAGERERKTLETLLATRLPDRAIVLGKIGVAVLCGWSASIIALLIGLLIVNAVHWEGAVILYTPAVLFANLVLGLLVSLLTASLGTLISLRAKGVQEAQQLLVMILMLPPMIAGFLAFAFLDRMRDSIRSADGNTVVIIVLLSLAILSILLAGLALHRFRRDRIESS